jgi:hypothetical protein
MWLRDEDGSVFVDGRLYIQSQPVSYEQIAETIETIRARGLPVRAVIDVTGVRLSHVNILGVIDIVWDLHERTYDENLLSGIELVGATPRMIYMWDKILLIMPEFLRV